MNFFSKEYISSYKIQPERSAKKERGRTGRNSPRTPFPPRLHLGPGTGKEYKKIREYSDGLPVFISNCKIRMELFFKGLKIRLRVLFKESSNFGQKAQPELNGKIIFLDFMVNYPFSYSIWIYGPITYSHSEPD